MKPIAVRRPEASVAILADRILCYDVRDGSGRIVAPKGARLTADSARVVLAAPWDELHVVAGEPGDLHEEQAGDRLARAVTGGGVEVKGYSGGQWTLTATRRGLLRIATAALAEINGHGGISVFSLFDRQPVDVGEIVARAKVTPLLIAEATVVAVERRAATEGVVRVAAFQPRTIGAVARESREPRPRERCESALRLKIEWLGGRLLPVRFATGTAGLVAAALTDLRDQGAEVLVVAGASALDPLDPVFGALELLGARMERHGAPAHPGSLLWLARWEGRPVLGMPTCGMFSQATTFDLVLPRLLAGETVGNAELAALGHGGLLSREMAYRFPPYRSGAARGELE